MIRRLTIAFGVLTIALVAALALQDHTLFGARPGHRGQTLVTAIPDRPPVKPVPPAPSLKALPPAPAPAPQSQTPASARPAAPTPVKLVVDIARTLLNLPKILGQTQANPNR